MKKENLKNSDHCRLCDNMHFDFNKGVFCGLNMQRPEFNNKCIKIDLNKIFKEKIEAINIEYQSVLKTKTDTFGHVIIYAIVTILVIVLNYVITQYIFNLGYVSTISIILFVLALIPLGKVAGLINTYRTKLSIAKKKKETLDEITNLYRYSYDINIEHFIDSLGNIEHKVDLLVTRN
ncbi:hypothetical protein [uncultured Algibacter sp.]|uniref:hypothetical protein n=1 Tax=uncultured Algibacter sp. TaxID=298659 RepID=UPI00260CDCCE|nr:hypothetical protein [uncultured Algibacter sp.]